MEYVRQGLINYDKYKGKYYIALVNGTKEVGYLGRGVHYSKWNGKLSGKKPDCVWVDNRYYAIIFSDIEDAQKFAKWYFTNFSGYRISKYDV